MPWLHSSCHILLYQGTHGSGLRRNYHQVLSPGISTGKYLLRRPAKCHYPRHTPNLNCVAWFNKAVLPTNVETCSEYIFAHTYHFAPNTGKLDPVTARLTLTGCIPTMLERQRLLSPLDRSSTGARIYSGENGSLSRWLLGLLSFVIWFCLSLWIALLRWAC